MRLRNLRKLEEMEIKGEHADLKKEQKELQALLKSEDAQWKKIADELWEVRKIFDPKSDVGKRRTSVEDAPAAEEINLEQLIEKEPVTVILSDKSWVRTMKGHALNKDDIKYKDGDEEAFVIQAMSTDKLMLFGTDGKILHARGQQSAGRARPWRADQADGRSRHKSPKPKPDPSTLGFGNFFSDHMSLCDWEVGKGWHSPRIVPYGPLPLDPAAAALHYGQELFEGS